MTFVVNNDTVYESVADILATYTKQGNWEQSHTDLLVEGISKLLPGQRLVVARDLFIASGVDKEGEWMDRMDHPRVIQLADDTILELIRQRVSLAVEAAELSRKIMALTVRANSLDKQLTHNEGAMHKHGNVKGIIRLKEME